MAPPFGPQAPPVGPKTPPRVPKKPLTNSKINLAGWKASPSEPKIPPTKSTPAASAASPLQSDSKFRLLRRPLCIICGRPKEAEEIAKALGVEENRVLGREVEGINDGHTFYLGSFDLGDKRAEKLDYYVTSSLRQGIQSFTIHASILFHILRPRYAIHAGVCASYAEPDLQKRFKLKDVIISEAALNYEEGKWETDGEKTIFRPDYDISRTPTGDMQAFAESRLVSLPISLQVTLGFDNLPHYRYGDFISGSAVRQDANDIFEKIRSNVARNAIGLDMEASAFIKLCEYSGVKSLGVIKGISDFGDFKKGEDPAAYGDALRNTGFALKEWCTHSIPAVNWQPDDDMEPGGTITTGYYDNFVRMVLDAHGQGWPVKLKDDAAVTIPNDEILGLKVVMPKDFKAEFFGEGGQIHQTTVSHGIASVSVGGRNYSRTLHYKAGYLIDFPRTTNGLAGYKDSIYQVQVFQRVLQKKPYFVSLDGRPLAEACSWYEFTTWLKTVDATEKKNAADESARKAADAETVERAEQENEGPIVAEKDLRSNSVEQYVGSTGDKGKFPRQQSLIGSSEDQKPLGTQTSWSFVEDPPIMDDDDEDEGGYQPPACPPPPKVPLGWRPIWDNQYKEYYFVDIYTKRSRWQLPTKPNLPRGDSPSPALRRQTTSIPPETMSVRPINTRKSN